MGYLPLRYDTSAVLSGQFTYKAPTGFFVLTDIKIKKQKLSDEKGSASCVHAHCLLPYPLS